MDARPRPRLFQNADFMRLWTAQGVSALGGRFTRTAIPMIAISLLAATPAEVSLLAILGIAPAVIVALLAGGSIDRSRKRLLLIAMDIVRAGLVLSVPVMAFVSMLSFWHLALVAALVAAASAVFNTADNAFLPVLVDQADLVDANSKLQSTEATAEIAGPSIAGLMIQSLGAPIALLADGLSYLWSAVWLWRIGAQEPAAQRPEPKVYWRSVPADVAHGWRLCLRNPLVRPLLQANVVWSLFGGFFAALYMLFAMRVLGLSEGTVGIVIGMGGIGALLGALIAARFARAFGLGRAIMLALGIGQAGMILIPLAGLSSAIAVPALLAHQLISDAAFTIYLILVGSLRQSVLPQISMARAQSAFTVAETGSLVLGAVMAGALAEILGTNMAIAIGVAGGLFSVLPLQWSPLARLPELPHANVP